MRRSWRGSRIGSAITAASPGSASYYVNINRFSLHALYRNRLIRAYLGASRQERDPDRFTGFDAKTIFACTNYGRRSPATTARIPSLFHVINIALNVVSTKRLAWQERKAESFTVTPRHCGSAYLGFRPSNEYGGAGQRRHLARHGDGDFGRRRQPQYGLQFLAFDHAVADAVQRAARLVARQSRQGRREFYQTEGPKSAAKPLFDEAFGQTTDESPFVYLSDGGHFEDLGLYEMVRRRCRFIVVVDAGCDPNFAFEDLGNAVRKIYIDLGMRIEFEASRSLIVHPKGADAAILSIRRRSRRQFRTMRSARSTTSDADGGGGCDDGTVLYIKPAYHGTEGAGIRSYAIAHRDLPARNRRPTNGSPNRSSRAIARSGWISPITFSPSRDVQKALHDF